MREFAGWADAERVGGGTGCASLPAQDAPGQLGTVDGAGSCDEDVINHVGDYLAKDPEHKHFTQILTLNSHLPVFPDQASSAILRCGEANAMISDDAACNLMGLVIRAERAVAKVAIRPDLPETEFLIVGDHAPPFMLRSRRDMFSQYEVPYFQLIPRCLDKNSSQKQ